MPPDGCFILHLSDLHIKTVKDARLWSGQLSTDLREDLGCRRLDALVISGDVGNFSRSGEYSAAQSFLAELCEAFRLTPDRLTIVPGNHDLNWTLSERGYRLAKRSSVKQTIESGHFYRESDNYIWLRKPKFYPRRFANFCKFHQDASGRPYPLEEEAQWTLCHLSEHGVLILGLNSSWQIDHHFTKRAGIHDGALEEALRTIHNDPTLAPCLKIAVWHHPLESRDEDRITDRGFLQCLAAAGFCMALHGHIHKADAGLYRYDMSPGGRRIHIVGAGTFGAPVRDWTPGYPLQYNLIRLSGRQATVETRRRIEPGGAWEPDAMWRQGKGKDPLPRYAIDLPQSVGPGTVSERGEISEAIPKKSESDPAFEKEIANYGKTAAALHTHLPLAGFQTRLRVPIRVEDIYVPLRAMVDTRAIGGGCFGNADEAEECLKEAGRHEEISLPEAFKESEALNRRGIVILGDPGSGKTTHLKRLLLWCLKGRAANTGLPPDMLPVFLPLRDLKELDEGLEPFIQKQLANRHLRTASNFGQRLLRRGRLLLLFDGLDEVADPDRRAEVSRWIAEALDVYDTCRFVVTCRFAGYSDEVRLNERFLEMYIRPLSDDQAKAFVERWYAIVEGGIRKDPKQARTIAAERAAELWDRLTQPEFRSLRLMQMTRNPLLLTNLCLVHRDRRTLPEGRARLYDECIQVLLELWRGAKKIPSVIDPPSGRRVLQAAAFWLHEEDGRTRATAGELAPVIEPALAAEGWRHGSARNFLKTVRDQSGLLTGWGHDLYGFMHLGFQEYLAAEEIRQQFVTRPAVLDELAGRFGRSWWQEVLLLTLALNNPALFEPLMDRIVRRPAFAEHPDLAELCLNDSAIKSAGPFARLLDEDPENIPELWPCQMAALDILARMAPAEIEKRIKKLGRHPSDAIRQWLRQRENHAGKTRAVTAKIDYELVQVPGGEFQMGSPKNEEGRWDDEGPVHPVRVPAFLMGRYPVTNEQYGRYLEANPNEPSPKFWTDSQFNQPRQPVVGVSWEDARRFATWSGLRLPSEAEWEYACRSGTKTRFHTGDGEKDLDRAGWYEGNSGRKVHPVGEKEPNAFGLYDMHGNVWEWVEDDWHNNYNAAPSDGKAWIDDPRGQYRVWRGGCWSNVARYCRSAYRYSGPPGYRNGSLGFRLALSPGR